MKLTANAKRILSAMLVFMMVFSLVPMNVLAASDAPIDAAVVFTELHTNKSNYKQSTVAGIFGALKDSGLPISSVTSGGDAFSVNEDSGKYTGYTCACGESYVADEAAALGHSYTAVESDGYMVYTCHCGHSYSEKLTPDLSYVKVSSLSDDSYVITLSSGGKYYALSHENNTISVVQVTVSDNQITSEVTEDLVWSFSGSKFSYVSGGQTYYLYAQSASGWFAWFSAPTLTISTGNSTTVSLSSNKLKMSNYYLTYSNNSVSLSRNGTTAALFAETEN